MRRAILFEFSQSIQCQLISFFFSKLRGFTDRRTTVTRWARTYISHLTQSRIESVWPLLTNWLRWFVKTRTPYSHNFFYGVVTNTRSIQPRLIAKLFTSMTESHELLAAETKTISSVTRSFKDVKNSRSKELTIRRPS